MAEAWRQSRKRHIANDGEGKSHNIFRNLRRKKRSVWVHKGRTSAWWDNMINSISPDECWKKNFRMSKSEFMALCDELRPFIEVKDGSPNYRSLKPEKKLAVTLYFLKDTGSIWMTANVFGIHQSTVSKVVVEVCGAITEHLTQKYVHLPQSEEEMQEKVAEFESKFGMIQAFGCIDGTHVPIKAPSENSQDYFNYKQFHSLNVQAVCDYKGLFLDVECMWSGCVHDAKVFANSKIANMLQNNKLPKTFKNLLPGHEKIPNYLIGDPAYPLTAHCMKEYESCKTNEEVIFNNLLRSARNPIECAFGRLKARWRILKKKIDLKLTVIPIVVLACFTLHNYCESMKSCIDEDILKAQIESNMRDTDLYKNIPDPIYSGTLSEGQNIRNILTKYIKQNLPDEY